MGVPEKQPSFVQPHFTAMGYQWTMPEWNLKLYKRCVSAARRLSGTLQSRELEWTSSSHDIVPWEGAGETEGDCKPMK